MTQNGETMDNEGGHLNHPHRWRHAKKRFRKAAEAYCRALFYGVDIEKVYDAEKVLEAAFEHLERTR